MQYKIKNAFDREFAEEMCRIHYRVKGYSAEHCHGHIDHLSDREIERVFNIILEEIQNAKKNK